MNGNFEINGIEIYWWTDAKKVTNVKYRINMYGKEYICYMYMKYVTDAGHEWLNEC